MNLVNANIFYILIIIHFDLFFQSQSQLYLKRVILTPTKTLFLPLSLTIYILFPFSLFCPPLSFFLRSNYNSLRVELMCRRWKQCCYVL